MPLQMSGPRLYPLTTFTSLGCLFLSFQAEVIFLEGSLTVHTGPLFFASKPSVWPLAELPAVVDPCLDPGSKGLVRVLLCVPGVRADLR